MSQRTSILLTLGLAVLFASCDSARQRETSAQVTAEQVNPRVQGAMVTNLESLEKNGLTVTPYRNLRSKNEAGMRLASPQPGLFVTPGPVNFVYQVTNYRLGEGAESSQAGVAISPLGQAITTIVDNETVTEHATPTFTEPMTEGDHVVLSFLSRSSRESLKHRSGFDLRTVRVGSPAGKQPGQPAGADPVL